MKKGPVWESLLRLAGRLDRENIPYALVGGLALIAHGYERFTRDVDVPLTPESLDLADVQDLIGVLRLPLELADRLDSSVADEYRRLRTERRTGSPDPHEQGEG